MITSSVTNDVLDVSKLLNAPLTTSLAYDGEESKPRKLPAKKLDILPKDLVLPVDRVIMNLDVFLAAENVEQLRNLWRFWLHGQLREGDTNVTIERSDGHWLYLMDQKPFFNHGNAFHTLTLESLKKALVNVDTYPDFSKRAGKHVTLEKNLFAAIRSFVDKNSSITRRQVFRVPTAKELAFYDPKPERTNPGNGLPINCVRLGTHSDSLLSFTLGKLDEAAAALATLNMAVFSRIVFTKDEKSKRFSIIYDDFHYAFVDYFDFLDEKGSKTQRLGAWGPNGFKNIASMRGMLEDSYADTDDSYITNEKLKSFRKRIKEPYNEKLRSGLYEVSNFESELLACRDFKICSIPRAYENAEEVIKNFSLEEVRAYVDHWENV